MKYHRNKHGNATSPKITPFLKKLVGAKYKRMIADAVVRLAAMDMRPLTIVEDPGMIYLINTIIKVVCKLGLISAEEILPCADTVKNRMDVIVKEVREEMKTEFANVSFISCTTDHWFEAYNTQDYMTITVQYYDSKSHKLATRVIGTSAVDDKTGETTIKYFDEKVNQLNMREKVKIVVTDNADAMKKAFKNDQLIGCSSHNLALAQRWTFNQQNPKEPESEEGIVKIISAAKYSVTHVKKTGFNAQFVPKLKQECEIRWDTNHDMLESILLNYDALEKIDSLECYLVDMSKVILKHVIEILAKFKKVRTSLSAGKSPLCTWFLWRIKN